MESLEAVSLGRRLDHLERAHRRLKRAVAGLIALAAVGVMGQAAVTRLNHVETDSLVVRDMASNDPVPRAAVVPTGWGVVNSNVKFQALLRVLQGRADFFLAQSDGTQRVRFLASEETGANFELHDSSGVGRVVSYVNANGAVLSVRDSKGTVRTLLNMVDGFSSPQLILSDSAGKFRAILTTGGLTLIDEAGKIRAVLGETDVKTTTTGPVEHRQSSSLVLFDQNGKVLWKSP